jgi:hypothetical protein
MAEAQRRVLRLPAAPLVSALHWARVTRGVTWGQLLSSWQLRAYYLAKAEGEVTPYMVRQLCAAIGQDPDELYADGLPRVSAEPAPEACPADRCLPAAPLVEAVEARLRRIAAGLAPLTDPGAARGEAVRAVFGTAEAIKRAFYRARRGGWLTLECAEQLCDYFGWHPYQLWGDAYDAAALAGTAEDFNPWEGVA